MVTPSPLVSAEILAVGTELLVGETRDTNSGDLAAELTALGVAVGRISQLPDELDVVIEALRAALSRADIVLTTGGLGPTPDDLTREAIAATLGRDVYVDPELEAWLRGLWERRGLPFSEVNLKQAWLVAGATALRNPHGTAPGWWVETDGRVIIALPGPPRELHPMWRERALPRLRDRGLGADRAAETLRLTGIGESAVVDLIGEDILRREQPQVATYARLDAVDVRVSATGDGQRSARQIVDAAVADLLPIVDPYLFARGEDGWPEALTGRLGERRVAIVEMGTAGQLGALLGTAPWLALAEHLPVATPSGPGPEADAGADLAILVAAVRSRARAEVGLGVRAHSGEDDMAVEVRLDIDGSVASTRHTAFRGGEIGRRRAANIACAELWRRLGEVK